MFKGRQPRTRKWVTAPSSAQDNMSWGEMEPQVLLTLGTPPTACAAGREAPPLSPEKEEPREREVPPSLGALLRKRRESLGVSVRVASQDTRISTGFIAALEDDDFRSLPGEAYALGFLRTYAEYLGLDPDAMLVQYKAVATDYKSTQPFWVRHRKTWAELRNALLAMLIVGAAWVAYMMFGLHYHKPETVEIVALRDCNLVISDDGEPRQQHLRAGDRLILRTAPTLRVLIEDEGSVAVSRKGIQVGKPDFLVYSSSPREDSWAGE